MLSPYQVGMAVKRLIVLFAAISTIEATTDGFIPLTGPEITEKLAEAELERRAALENSCVTRRYVVMNQRLGQKAEMLVRVTYRHSEGNRVEVLSQTGSERVKRCVFQKLIQIERAGIDENARIIPPNYEFEAAGMEKAGGQLCYILNAKPRSKNKFMMQGRVWVGSEDFQIIRMEGRFVERLSLWLGRPSVVQTFTKVGPIWVLALSHAETDSHILGLSELTVESFNYEFSPLGTFAAIR